MQKIILLIIFTLFTNFSIFSQNQISVNSPQLNNSKIAFVTSDFYTQIEKKNLSRKQYNIESDLRLEKIKVVSNKIWLLYEESRNKKVSSKSKTNWLRQLNDLKSQREDLIRELNKFRRRFNLDVFKPLNDEFWYIVSSTITENSFIFVYDSEIPNSILAVNPKIDISNQFRQIVNEYFETGIKPNLQIEIPESKIASIKINELGNKIIEISNLTPTKNFLADNPKLAKALQDYADEKGFNLIINSSQNIPYNLENISVQDVTKDFISYYNQLNP